MAMAGHGGGGAHVAIVVCGLEEIERGNKMSWSGRTEGRVDCLE